MVDEIHEPLLFYLFLKNDDNISNNIHLFTEFRARKRNPSGNNPYQPLIMKHINEGLDGVY